MRELRRIRAGNIEAVEAVWQQFVPTARLQRADPARFHFAWDSTSVPDFTIMEYQLDAQVKAVMTPEAQLFAGWVRALWARVETRPGSADPTAPWACHRGEVEAEWVGNAHVRAFIFGHDFAQQAARTMSGQDRLILRVHESRPISADHAAAWTSAFGHVRRLMLEPGPDGSRLVEAELRRHAVRMTLMTFPTTLAETLRRPAQRGPAERTVRVARAFMDENAQLPITVDNVARAVHMSTRGLQYAFRRATGETPTRYLRRVRIEGAHDDLQNGFSGTVKDLAARWGFAHPSRFAAYYKEQYGRFPSESIR